MEATLTEYAPHLALAVSLLAALLLDCVVTRALLEAFKPTSAYVFRIGRIGKLTAVLAWIYYFTGHWYPQYAGGGAAAPRWVGAAAGAAVGILILAALATLPRGPRAKGARSG